jgi:hypothetical protein
MSQEKCNGCEQVFDEKDHKCRKCDLKLDDKCREKVFPCCLYLLKDPSLPNIDFYACFACAKTLKSRAEERDQEEKGVELEESKDK